jgi:Zn ribbon nucleic-acid-binding protein
MASLRIECLGCGEVRVVQTTEAGRIEEGECPRCGYVGWAASASLDEALRHWIRTRPLGRRRLYPA